MPLVVREADHVKQLNEEIFNLGVVCQGHCNKRSDQSGQYIINKNNTRNQIKTDIISSTRTHKKMQGSVQIWMVFLQNKKITYPYIITTHTYICAYVL